MLPFCSMFFLLFIVKLKLTCLLDEFELEYVIDLIIGWVIYKVWFGEGFSCID